MKRICPRCNEPLFSNCYVKDKGINTLSYLELIIKKEQFQKENKEIKSCYCSKCGYVELYIDIDDSNKHQHLKKDDDLNSLRQTVRQYAIDYHQRIELERKNERKEILDKKGNLNLLFINHIYKTIKKKT
ncbi:MAG: hypothetical protein ACLR43_02185 [Faecalibacillus faecis]